MTHEILASKREAHDFNIAIKTEINPGILVAFLDAATEVSAQKDKETTNPQRKFKEDISSDLFFETVFDLAVYSPHEDVQSSALNFLATGPSWVSPKHLAHLISTTIDPNSEESIYKRHGVYAERIKENGKDYLEQRLLPLIEILCAFEPGAEENLVSPQIAEFVVDLHLASDKEGTMRTDQTLAKVVQANKGAATAVVDRLTGKTRATPKELDLHEEVEATLDLFFSIPEIRIPKKLQTLDFVLVNRPILDSDQLLSVHTSLKEKAAKTSNITYRDQLLKLCTTIEDKAPEVKAYVERPSRSLRHITQQMCAAFT